MVQNFETKKLKKLLLINSVSLFTLTAKIMDEKTGKYGPSEFLKNNRNFLKDYCFKFEGLTPECERGFTHIVKDLGGKVSNKAKYTLVEKSYFEKEKNKERKDLYHLNFILDSLNVEKLLDIESYRCDKINTCSNKNNENSPLNENNKNRENSSSILQNRSNKHNDNDNNVVRNNSVESNSDHDIPISEMMKQSKSQDKNKILKKNNSKVLRKKLSNVRSDTESSSSDESTKLKTEQLKSQDKNKILKKNNSKVLRKKLSNVRSDTESSSSNESIKLKTEPKSTESSEDDSDSPLSENKTVNVKREASNSNDSTDYETDSEPLTKKRRKKESDLTPKISLQKKAVSQNETNLKATKRTWVDTKDLENNAGNNESNNKERSSSPHSRVTWTKTRVEERDDLKSLFELDPNDLCKIKRCTFEPGPHESHSYAGRVISDEEKKIILKYLIKNNLIHRAKGIRTWELMIDSGYLTHRAPDTLRNCLRRVILPNICKFKLPEDILDKFLWLDEKKAKGKKIWD